MRILMNPDVTITGDETLISNFIEKHGEPDLSDYGDIYCNDTQQLAFAFDRATYNGKEEVLVYLAAKASYLANEQLKTQQLEQRANVGDEAE